jgi:hypothetical protein
MEHSTLLVPLALAGCLPATALSFLALPARRALCLSFLAAWLFLPIADYELPGIPDFNKSSAIALSALVVIALFQGRRLLSLRARWVDAPMLAWCLCPIASSLSNDLGLYDGLAASLTHFIKWGIPYLVGRLYFAELPALGELAVAIFVGGLVYVPLCLLECRLSPQLHTWVYGYHQHVFAQAIRFGGFRPTVFLEHGLVVAMWMAAATIVGAALALSGARRNLAGAPAAWLVGALFVTTLLCKSVNAWVALAVGLAGVGRLRAPVLFCLLVFSPLYMVARSTGWLDTDRTLALAGDYLPEERLQSLETRLRNEDVLVVRALERPLLGWAGWGRARIRDDDGNDTCITDGRWVIALGENGLVGLVAFTVALALPLLLLLRLPLGAWRAPAVAPAAALAIVLGLNLVDCMFNAPINPVLLLATGGLTGLSPRAVSR